MWNVCYFESKSLFQLGSMQSYATFIAIWEIKGLHNLLLHFHFLHLLQLASLGFCLIAQLKITILCVVTAAFTLIPLLILQSHSDTVQSTFTDRLCHNTQFQWAESTLLGRTRSEPEPVLALCLHFTVFASHLGHYQRRAETGIQSTD